ncbi:MAG: epoxyqueuosine reductase [Sedimentisphaerales bacterium]|nr:epoxyqueuosine reductase [Sedimentisphaerales bacterium]
MISTDYVKKIASELGADLCGIASVGRFEEAPAGFKPTDIYPDAKSVVVVARRFPEGAFLSGSSIPYTVTNDIIINEVVRITCNICSRLELQDDIIAVPVPGDPYEYWDEDKREGRGILSLRHAGYMAGLGVFGKNTLLTNATFGNRIVLGAVLLNVSLESDDLAGYNFCSSDCRICIENCPAGALGDKSVNQKLCRAVSQGHTKKGDYLYLCNNCRKLCPNGRGIN